VNEILSKELLARKHRAQTVPGKHEEIEGLEKLDKAIVIDQSAIGRTPRSNPATYTGIFTQIRELFAGTPEANIRGYKASRFSFNVKGGRCEACQGDGVKKIEMHFLPDVYVECDVCHGKRYNREALEIHYKGKTISDVLDMTVAEANDFFANIPAIARKLQTICDVGLGYIKLGQPATTFSGGEAQRIKLATELARVSTGKTMYILDEPTTGLHHADVKRLLDILNRLVDGGNSMVIIEHNLDVIKNADWLIDMGPEGGAAGGQVVATGTPEQIAKNPASWTGKYLAKIL
jgi:excinuclease ABC subunit A